jgi:putative addiction module component (TIGR02574 family)
MTRQEIYEAALKLDLRDRAELAHELLRSLDELSPEEIERLWLDEAERRLRELEEGRVQPIPGEQVLAEARARLR